MKVLVTGATGFIGRYVVSELRADEQVELVCCARTRGSLPPDVRFEAVDLLAPGAAADLIARVRPTHLLHLAWNAQPGRFWTALDNLDWTAASLVLMRAFADAGGRRAVMAGTCAEYDWTCGPRLSESDTPIRPATLYGVAKDALRRAAQAAAAQAGVSFAWGRVFWLYGPHETAGRLVSDVAAALCAGETVETTEGLQRRDFLHVSDVAGAFVAALRSDRPGAFNIGSGRPVAVRDVVLALAESLGRAELLRLGARPSPIGDPPELAASVDALQFEIGYRPSFQLEQGLSQTAAWWRERTTQA